MVGALQEVIFSEEFSVLTEEFVKKHCDKFVETEENTHEMWSIHKEYKAQIEKYVDKAVKKILPNYAQQRFIQLLHGREEQLDEGILDTFTGFDDFIEFKRHALEVRLRLLRREDPDKYKAILKAQKGYALVQEISQNLEMEDDLFTVKGLGDEEVF